MSECAQNTFSTSSSGPVCFARMRLIVALTRGSVGTGALPSRR